MNTNDKYEEINSVNLLLTNVLHVLFETFARTHIFGLMYQKPLIKCRGEMEAAISIFVQF